MNRPSRLLLVLCLGTGSVAVAQGGPSPGRRSVGPPALVLEAGLGIVSAGGPEVAGRVAVEQAVGPVWRLRLSGEAWVGSGDCVSALEPTVPCRNTGSGWSISAGVGGVAAGGRLSATPVVGVARSEGVARPMAGIVLGYDPRATGRSGFRVEASYQRLFGALRADRLTLLLGVRVALGDW
jgi:hypothetical protein